MEMKVKYLVNAKEMKQIDKDTIGRTGIPAMVLMERAALAVAEEIRQRVDAPSVLCVCGCGNNGADGLAVARILMEMGITADVMTVGNEAHVTEEWKQQRKIIETIGIRVVSNPNLAEYTVIVDALFGIGLSRPAVGDYARWIQRINESQAWVVSVDMPSGVDTDSGEVFGEAVKADITVTFGVQKAGLVFYPGAQYAGEVVVRQIGFPLQNIEGAKPQLYTFDQNVWESLPKRQPDLNKGSAGKVLVLAGSKNMAGAAYLCAKAAYRMGAGMVRILTPDINRQILQTLIPEAVLVTYETGEQAEKKLKDALAWADTIVAGPGMGTGEETGILLELLSQYVQCHKEKSVVLDADALNYLSENPKLWKGFSRCAIITPHMGEMARLMKTTIADVQKNRIALAKKAGLEYNSICVLKDARTVVCEACGNVYVNTSGNSGMATAGSGDVLSGVIAGCLAMGLPRRQAAEIGVWIHGCAGDAARAVIGERALMAQDIVEGISQLSGMTGQKEMGKKKGMEKHGDRCKCR